MQKILKNIYFLLGICTLLLFLFSQGVTGYVIGGDTVAYYIHFDYKIEVAPLYPLFFHVLDLIFGRGKYLDAAAVIQTIFAVVSIVIFVRFIGKNFRLGVGSIVIVWLCALIPFYLLLPEDPIPHVLMTESFTYPMMYLYMVLVLKGLIEKREKYFVFSALFVGVMAMVRGQMMFLYAITMFAYCIYLCKINWGIDFKKQIGKIVRKLLIVFLLCLICIKGGSILTDGYNRVFFGEPTRSFADHLGVQKALYLSDEEDAELFEDETVREIFSRTYSLMEKDKTLYLFAQKDLWLWKHAIESFGANSWYISDMTEEVLRENGEWSEDRFDQIELKAQYAKEIKNVLLKDNFEKYVGLFFELTPSAFISTVLFHKEAFYLLIHIATLCLYIGTLVFSFIVNKLNGELAIEAEYMWIVLLNGITNVISTNVVHMGVQRYQAYTVGMFYAGCFLMLRKVYLVYKLKRKMMEVENNEINKK